MKRVRGIFTSPATGAPIRFVIEVDDATADEVVVSLPIEVLFSRDRESA